MCAACVAQGAAYVGGAVAGLQVMRANARHKRDARRSAAEVGAAGDGHGEETQPEQGHEPHEQPATARG